MRTPTRGLKAWTVRAVERIDVWRWVLILAWRMSRGRWYIFRDAPDHVVCFFAVSDDDVVGPQARDEIKTRLQTMKATIARFETKKENGNG